MSSTINFTGVDKAADRQMTTPGTVGVFKIELIEFGATDRNSTPFMRATFGDDTTSFRHTFFTTSKALPKIQALAESATGQLLTGEMTEEGLKRLLEGKSVALKVIGQVNAETGKGYPDLGFGGFCKPVAQLAELKFSPKEQSLVADALEAIENSRAVNADSEHAEDAGPQPTGDSTGF